MLPPLPCWWDLTLAGIDRLFLALLCSAYDEDEIDGEKRSLLRRRDPPLTHSRCIQFVELLGRFFKKIF